MRMLALPMRMIYECAMTRHTGRAPDLPYFIAPVTTGEAPAGCGCNDFSTVSIMLI